LNGITKKAKTNLAKHRVSFEEATSVFRDKNMLSIFDEEYSHDEDRWITIGVDQKTRTLVVVHTFISVDKNATTIRVISARKATKQEQQRYWEG